MYDISSLRVKEMQMQSTYWLEKVLKMISLYVLCTLHLHLFNFLYRVRDMRPRWSTRRRAGFSCATLYYMHIIFRTTTVPHMVPYNSYRTKCFPIRRRASCNSHTYKLEKQKLLSGEVLGRGKN